jgi:hypothetical protein
MRDSVTSSALDISMPGITPSRLSGTMRMIPSRFAFAAMSDWSSSKSSSEGSDRRSRATTPPTRKNNGDAMTMQMNPSPKRIPDMHNASATVLWTVPAVVFGCTHRRDRASRAGMPMKTRDVCWRLE